MNLYLVNEVTDDEYGYSEAIAIFSSLEKAQNFVNENQYQWSAWFMKEGETENALSITEMVLDEEPKIIRE